MAPTIIMNGNLKKQFKYFLDHQDELVRKYNGKVVVIFDEAVDGVYESELAAVADAQRKHELGSFLVQKIAPGDDSYTQVFHSRVAFA